MQKHRFVFEVLVQRLEDFRTKYIWKCGSFGKGSTRREDMDKLNVLCTHLQSPAAVQPEKVSPGGFRRVAFLTSFRSAQWLLLRMRDS
jgi:hypothetical protein